MRARLSWIVVTVAALVALPQLASAQQTREGFWLSGGLGYGSLGCADCGERTNGLSGNFAIGGTINSKVLLGVSTHGWTKSESGVTLTAGTVTALLRFYPSSTGGFFLLGGLGLGSVDLDIAGFDSVTESGAGAALGLGYDIRVAPNVSLTPFWNGVGISWQDGDANIGQLGMGVTVH